ncbi:MAG: hypothetical protein PHN56_04200 [Candidatus Nanoarchaeia archaeon]|nr:hypothetical protein [Candidatus Nanoarchaeia archaeon]
MKILLNKKIIAQNICDCQYLKSLIGLRFRKAFKPYDCFIIYMAPDSVLDSYFVNFEFIAAWVDKTGKVIKIENCKKNKLFIPAIGQSRVYEFPINSKFKIKKGDKIEIKK